MERAEAMQGRIHLPMSTLRSQATLAPFNGGAYHPAALHTTGCVCKEGGWRDHGSMHRRDWGYKSARIEGHEWAVKKAASCGRERPAASHVFGHLARRSTYSSRGKGAGNARADLAACSPPANSAVTDRLQQEMRRPGMQKAASVHKGGGSTVVATPCGEPGSAANAARRV